MVLVKIDQQKFPPIVYILGSVPVRRPMFKTVMDYSPNVAQILIEKGFATPLDSNGVAVVAPSVAKKEDKEKEKEGENQGTLADEIPPDNPKVPEIPDEVPSTEIANAEGKAEDGFPSLLVEFFINNEAEYIANKIKWVGLDTAEKIKAQSDLTYDLIKEGLTDRQYNSAKEYLLSKK